MNCFKARIISNKKIAPQHYVLSFAAKGIAGKTKPGQFFNVRITGHYRPLLRRPFSAHRIGRDNIAILYKVVGGGTDILSRKRKGEFLDILGPLGNGFDFRFPPSGSQECVLVAGGHGIAPLYALAERLVHKGRRIVAFVGAKTKKHIVAAGPLKKLGAGVYVATEDGSAGYKGLVTDLLGEKMRQIQYGKRAAHTATRTTKRKLRSTMYDVRCTKYDVRCTIYACGPKPMLKTVAEIAERYDIPCRVLLEEYMACGIGTCLGCAVKTKSGYKMVCKDGPVFDSREIIWG